MRNIKNGQNPINIHLPNAFLFAGLMILITTVTGCGLERDEHTVQFQQLNQPNENVESLSVWLDVYSKSVIQDVYSPRGSSEVLP